MAVNSFRGSRGIADTSVAKESRTIAPMVVAGSLVQISCPNFGSYCTGRSACVAASSTWDPIWLVRRNGGGKPALHGSGHPRAPVTAAGKRDPKPVSGNFVRHLDVRIRRYRLLLVDSVAAHGRGGSRR